MSKQIDANKVNDAFYELVCSKKLTKREMICLGECILLWNKHTNSEKRQKAIANYMKTVYHNDIKPCWISDLLKNFEKVLGE